MFSSVHCFCKYLHSLQGKLAKLKDDWNSFARFVSNSKRFLSFFLEINKLKENNAGPNWKHNAYKYFEKLKLSPIC